MAKGELAPKGSKVSTNIPAGRDIKSGDRQREADLAARTAQGNQLRRQQAARKADSKDRARNRLDPI